MTQAFGGWVLDHHALASWARVEPYAQAVVWSAMEVGMTVAVPAAALPHAHAAVRDVDRDVLRTLLDLPVAVLDPLERDHTPELGRLLAAADPSALGSDALALACVIRSARSRGWPVLTAHAGPLRALDSAVEIDELP